MLFKRVKEMLGEGDGGTGECKSSSFFSCDAGVNNFLVCGIKGEFSRYS